MSTKQAPPLGNLTRGQNEQTQPLPTPVVEVAPVKELVFSKPGVPTTMDFSKVGGDAGRAIAEYVPQEERPLPLFNTPVPSRPELPVSSTTIQQLSGDESTPFNYTGFGAGQVGTEQIQVQPTAGIPRVQTDIGKFIDNPLNAPGTSNVVIANSTPVQSFDYSAGLTQSQRNSRDFFSGVQEWRSSIQPHMLPALAYTPQQLNPGVAGGFSPTAETKGPWSWLIDGPQKNINPAALEFGASGGGILGGLGWVFGRMSPVTWLQGAAMDVSRSAAALWEGGAANVSEFVKTGDLGKAWDAGLNAMSENYYSNSPIARGLHTETFGGSRAVGEELSQSYFLAAVTGMGDYSFSGTGNNPLLTGDANRNIVNKEDNFNPFGFREPIRSGFQTGALEAKERQQGAWFGHGYDQWARGALGLIGGDIVGSGFIDAKFLKVINGKTATVAKTTQQVARTSTQEGIEALRRDAARNAPGALVHVPRKIELRDIPDITQFIRTPTKSSKGGVLVPTAKTKEYGITQVVEGELIDPSSGTSLVNRPRYEPRYTQPIAQRYLPQGSDPFSVKSSRVYVPDINVDFSDGGAIIPYKGESSSLVPATLGVGGKPGGIPSTPRVEDGRVFIAGNEPPVTTWVDGVGFVTTGNTGTRVERVMQAPGVSPAKRVDDIIDVEAYPQRALPQYQPLKPDVPTVDTITPNTQQARAPINSRTIFKSKRALEDLPDRIGTNIPDVPITRPVEPPSGLSDDVSTTTKSPVTTYEPPPLVPKNTPNFTVQPTTTLIDDGVRATHTVDEITGVIINATEQTSVQSRKTTTQVFNDLAPVVPVPTRDIEYINAEAISPSLSSADIVRRLTSGEDIAGAVYNPRQVQRQERSIASVVSLARQVTLPGGVRILDDSIKDVSVMKFSRLQKKVDAAIIASGMNPSSSEAIAIRRLFDRNGKPLPSNLSPDFMIEVAPRTTDTPSVFVQPAKTVDDGNVTWTGRAARYSETYPLSDDYAVGIKVKYDEELGRIVPVDGQDMKMIPAVRTEPITRSQLRELPVNTRQAVVSKSFKDGYAVPKGAVDDVLSPDVATDVVAARDYARANLPKDSVPVVFDRKTRTELNKHHELTSELSYTGDLITDVSTQLTDVERSLAQAVKRVDELPDVGIRPLTDDVPFVPAIKRNDNVQESILDVESIVQGSDYRNIQGTVPIVIRDSNDIDATFTHLAGDLAVGNPRPPVIIVDEVQLPYAMAQVDEFVDDFKTVKHNNPHSSIVDTESLVDMYNPSMDTQRLEELFTQGTFLIPVVRRESNGTFTPISGGRYVAEYKNAIKASGDRLQERMRVNIVNGDTVAETATPTGRNTEVATPANKLYHGTRVKDLNLGSVDPLEGAARSEYGTGLWLTNSQDIALAASGRSVPANSVPNVNRVFTDDSFIHELDADVLQDLNIVKATDEVDVFTRSSLVDGVLDSSDAIDDVVPYGLRLREELSEALDFKKGLKYSDIFSITDDMTRKVSNKVIGTDPDELELTYVQRWITDILKRNDIDGMTNGVNTAVYNTYPLKARFVHDVTDIAGDAGDDITTALHSVNLLQKSYDADPTSTLLKVQLEEAKLVATARVRDSLSDELETLNALQSRQLSELMDQDDVLKQLTEAQRAEARIKASVKDDNTYDSFSKELNKDWNGPCL